MFMHVENLMGTVSHSLSLLFVFRVHIIVKFSKEIM